MNQLALAWTVLVLGSMVTGASVVGVLVARRSLELPIALAGMLGFAAASFAMTSLPRIYERSDIALWAFVFLVASGAGGYALTSTLLHRLAHQTGLEPLVAGERDQPPRVAVIVTACIEPESYDPHSTAGMLQQLADEDLLEASVAALPFIFFAQKARYRAIGDKSPASSQLDQVAERLRVGFGDSAAVTWATCSGAESVDRAVVQAANQGFGRVVVAGLHVAEPVHYVQIRNVVEDLRVGRLGVDVRFTAPLFDAERVMMMLASRVMAAAAGGDTGIVLVGHGQPESRAKRHPGFDERELSFLSRVRMMLLERGMDEESVRVAWADWTTPDVTSTVRHLVALGRRRVLVVPAVFPLDTLATRLDLEMAVRQARVNEGVSVVTLPGWRDDEAVIAELRERVVEAAAKPG